VKQYAVLFEKTSTGWSAHAPDLPGLGVAGFSFEETERLMREGIQFHIEGFRSEAEPVPEPNTRVSQVSIRA
jgi:predicted RNase H-like HicB family nuclease